MNILVLNGSPRPNGNTKAMVTAFAEGARESGNQVAVIDVCKLNIAGCLACEHCHTKEKGICIQKDDMQQVYPLLEEAEMIVLASPIYYHSFTGQLQCAVNRIYALDKPKKLKKAGLILSSGDDHVYSAAIFEYQNSFLNYLKLEDMGIHSAHGKENGSDEKLKELREFGRSLKNKKEQPVMIYKNFQNLSLSALGLGLMRLPVIDGNEAMVDEAAAAEMIDYAYNHGVNYFDTAWGYHNGNSELTAGKYLSRYPRESFYMATKFPGYDNSNMPKVKEIFEEQLIKCQTEYFDFYLFHNVYEGNIDDYLNPEFGILEYLLEQKRNGRIKHLGFSTHGSLEVMKRFLDAYGEHLEFCQIQLNYMDWHFQDADKKVELLKEAGIPIWIMEPLRGGRLAKVNPEMEAAMKALRPEETIPAWAFRFLQSIPGVTMVLSGMSNMEQLQANLATYEAEAPLNKEEFDTLVSLQDAETAKGGLPCTACHYCTSHCPQELPIPELIALYNEHKVTGGGFIAPMAVSSMAPEKRPANCVGCRSCEQVCPQQIQISEMMSDFTAMIGM